MKLTQIRLAGQGAWPNLALPALSPELNVLYGPPHTGKSTIAQLAGHLLYGKADSPWRRQFAQSTPLVEGSIDVDSPQGRFVLRRHRDGSPHGRLTVASAAGVPVDGRTIRTLLGGLSASLLSELYAVDFAEAPQAGALLAGEFARQFTLALEQEGAESAVAGASVCQEHATPAATHVDRRHLDELVRRRDDIVRQIEEQMAARRRDSAAIEGELARLDDVLGKRRAQAEELAARLHAVEAKLAEVSARLRYVTLEATMRPQAPADAEHRREALDRLDQDVSRCRAMLGDLQSREAGVRRELAEVHPDGTADSVCSLAEERATIGVLERLLDDLDAEVAGLARSHEPGRCIAHDAHARILPVAQMLRQRVYALCGQISEQERAARRVQSRAELRQLSRAQTDLSEQLEHLLERRQALVYETQLAGRVVAAPPQGPVAGHCQCDRHEEFIHGADELLLGRSGHARLEDDARARRSELEAQRAQLRESFDTVNREIAELAAHWDRLQQERAGAAGHAPLDELRAELARLEAEVNRALHAPLSPLAASPAQGGRRRLWKASDVLAQLSGGQLTQIRLHRDGRTATIVDRQGRLLVVEDLTAPQNDQLYLALVLALISSLASRGIELPLVLDEPFLRQDAPAAAAMVGVLAEFAREGRQTLVITEDRDVVRRFQSLGVEAIDVDAVRRAHQSPLAAAPAPAASVPAVRVVRETVGDMRHSLRSAGARLGAAGDDPAIDKPVHYLTVDASLADFPVLGNDTALVFSSLGVRTVEDLLAADAADVARRLAHPSVTPDAVRLWQHHTSLMCFVPGVSLADAQVLAACDVASPEALFNIDVRLLAETIARFLGTERGRRFASSRDRFSRERLALLQKHARRGRDRWQLLSPRYGWVERPVESRPVKRKTPPRTPRPERPAPAAPAPRLAPTTKQRPLRFLLDRSSPVAAAPSISRACAERLAHAGIRTVADLLNASPESTAGELADRRIAAETIVRWQREARLACRIPELRGYGAQLLVACGFTEPEQIARMSVNELLAKVRTFCRTSAGKRLLRGNEGPTPERVAAWIRHAGHTRPLEAA